MKKGLLGVYLGVFLAVASALNAGGQVAKPVTSLEDIKNLLGPSI